MNGKGTEKRTAMDVHGAIKTVWTGKKNKKNNMVGWVHIQKLSTGRVLINVVEFRGKKNKNQTWTEVKLEPEQTEVLKNILEG